MIKGYVKYEGLGRIRLCLVQKLCWRWQRIIGPQKRGVIAALKAVATGRRMRQRVRRKCRYLHTETTSHYIPQESSTSKTGLPNTCLFKGARSSLGNGALNNWIREKMNFGSYYYYLAGCPMFPHIPAPISQSCDLSPPIVSISPIFFL